MKNLSILLLPILLLAGCTTNPKDFKLIFTMESINAYKLSIEISNDKSYRIRQQNLFFDAYVKKEQINSAEGKLTDEEFSELTKRITDSRLFTMKNTYGFSNKDDSKDPLESLIYQIDYTEGSKSKFILIHPNPDDAYPGNLSKLINFLSNYTSAHLQKQ
ncbi:MAG: hypothetical protein FWF53_01785 [Candidatus Azobacteroides sp.]|nr:hypothetical protein [Candidatus Azobacteroides sp.]